MTTADITATMQGNAVWVVFANVLLQQVGLPVPAVPTLLAAGSLAMSFGQAGQLLAAAILASVFADLLWYVAGRAFGYRVLSGLCKLSLNPGSCVSSAEALFMRWGARSLVVAKFIPGFSTVGPPIAGSLKLPLPSFLTAASVGAGLWAGSAILTGWILRAQVHAAMAILTGHEALAIGVVAFAVGLWLGWTWLDYLEEAPLRTVGSHSSHHTDGSDGGHEFGYTPIVARPSRTRLDCNFGTHRRRNTGSAG